MAKYDLFISHASEDKAAVARPLAHRLREAGLYVWYDEFSLHCGDSLAQSIDKGLRDSEFAVVILSPIFFEKNWPRRELDGLVAREMGEGKTIILPVWHNVTADEVRAYSPPLADKLAVLTSEGLDEVVDAVFRVVATPSDLPPSEVVSIAILAHLLLGLQDLHRIYGLFPDLRCNREFNRLYDTLVSEVETLRSDSHLSKPFKIYERPHLDDPESQLRITTMCLLTLSTCRGGENVWQEERTREAARARVRALEQFLPERIKHLLEKVIELKVFHCRVPNAIGNTNLSTPARKVGVVYEYWSLLNDIVSFQSKAPFGWTPHPLLRFIVSLQKRIEENLIAIPEKDDRIDTLRRAVDNLVNALLSGDPDIFSIDEWVNEHTSEAAISMEHLKLRFGATQVELTEPEQSFTELTTAAIKRWKRETAERWHRILKSAEAVRHQFASDESSSQGPQKPHEGS